MKKLFVPIVALAAVLAFTSCGKEDQDPPVITLPDGALVIDLGDEIAALKDVTAEDKKDGDVSSTLKVLEGLDFVGQSILKYSAKDKAGNEGFVTKSVTIRANNLFGNYSARQVPGEDSDFDTYIVNIGASQDPTKLVLTGFYGQSGWFVVFSGNGTSELTMETKTFNNGDITVTGKATYRKVATYDMYDFNFTVTDEDGSANYAVTFTRQ